VRGLAQTGQAEAAKALKAAANRALADLPVQAFPAVAPAALTRPETPEFGKRLQLVLAALRGRV